MGILLLNMISDLSWFYYLSWSFFEKLKVILNLFHFSHVYFWNDVIIIHKKKMGYRSARGLNFYPWDVTLSFILEMLPYLSFAIMEAKGPSTQTRNRKGIKGFPIKPSRGVNGISWWDIDEHPIGHKRHAFSHSVPPVLIKTNHLHHTKNHIPFNLIMSLNHI